MRENIYDFVGNTPLVRLRTGLPPDGPKAYVKLESFSPTGSVKDRMVLHIIRKAVSEGKLKPGDTVIDNTSGNTGASLGMVAAAFGLRAIVTTPDKTSQEKIDLIRSFGVEVIVTASDTAHDDPEGYYMIARTLAQENGYFDLDQYNSQENIEAHYLSTGPEIWEQTQGKITHFVCGIGTGGTFSGAARFLKEKKPSMRAIAVDPEGSILADYIKSDRVTAGHAYKVEGIGSDVIIDALQPQYVDEVITVSDKDSFNRARLISKVEGISGGGSSGSVAVAIEKVAAELSGDSLIIGIFADAGTRYLSKCYNDDWMRRQGYLPTAEGNE
ncbi:MAG: cystathionine beta-synthase [Candidatus Zixiibacteriota bacterium]|nr:MAG: cystathionine beta-synthase [candidate division Zixibacteria bacterium]